MPSTPTAEEICTFVSAALKVAAEQHEFADKVKRHKIVIKAITTSPTGVLVMDLGHQTARLGDENEPADATMRMTSDTANRFWQGKLNMLGAMTRGLVKVEGNLPAVVRAMPLAMKICPMYVDQLRKAGRTDLLVT
jgi:putative sterol carrier protein